MRGGGRTMKEIKGIRNIQKTGKALGYYKSAYAANARSSEAVKPVAPVKLSHSHDSHAGIEQTKLAYARLKDLSEEYRSFFKNEVAFENAYDEMDGSLGTDKWDEFDDFVDILVHFITLYNESLHALIDFDRYFQTDHHIQVLQLCQDSQTDLSNIGIRLEPDGIMRVHRHRMERMYVEHPESFTFFATDTGLSHRLIERFKQVKSKILDSEKDHYPEDELHGLIIDKKC